VTKMTEELKKGPYPSIVRELEKSKYIMPMYSDAMKPDFYFTLFGYGGYISIPGLGAGISSRVTKKTDILPETAFLRILDPGGGFYTADSLRKICEIADKYGVGLLHLHANTGTLEIKGIDMKQAYDMVKEINEKLGVDVGSTGDGIRNIDSCMGPALCEHALVDALAMRHAVGMACLEDQQFPRFPHKFKIKFSGCPNDCSRGVQKGDLAFIGIFKDLPIVNEMQLKEWVAAGGDVSDLCTRCPTHAIMWDGDHLKIDPDACIRCFMCINECPAIKPGLERGVAVLVGGKSGNRGKYGPQLAKAIIPFMEVHPPEYKELVDVTYKMIDIWDEHARRKERFGDFILRFGLDKFLEAMDIEVTPQIMDVPKTSAHIHYKLKVA
jgi:sulfite reductase alpha subunit